MSAGRKKTAVKKATTKRRLAKKAVRRKKFKKAAGPQAGESHTGGRLRVGRSVAVNSTTNIIKTLDISNETVRAARLAIR